MSATAMRICDALLPAIALGFDLTVSRAALTITAFALAYGLFQLVYGPVGSRIGPYRTVGLAAGAAAIGNLACLIAPNFEWLVAGRALSGMTAAAIIPMSLAYIGGVIPYEQRQAVLARFLTGQISGLIFGQVLSGLFAQYFGWRAVFVFLTIGFLLCAVVLMRAGRRLPRQPPPSSANPLVSYIKILRLPWARIVLVAVFVESLFIFGAFPFMSAHLVLNHGLTYLQIGAMMGGMGIGGLIYVLAVRRWLTMLGGEKGLVISGGLLLSGGFVLAGWSPVWPLILLAIVIIGLGFYFMHSTLQTNATQMAPFDRSSAISLFAFNLFIGQAIGASIFGLIGEQVGYEWVFTIAAICLIAVGIGLRHLFTRKEIFQHG
ncbi:MAG: MFS transporter [Pseudomonadota bacterium]